MNRRKKNKTSDVNDEVEELLRAAHDATLLKLTVNSHTVHDSSSDIHPDLDQRFRSLKAGSRSKSKPEASTEKMTKLESSKVKEVDGDDLLARFSALKASIPKPPPSTSSSLVGLDTSATLVGEDIVEEDEEDEVDKVIRWAMDAARLDPSPASDDDDESSKYDDFDDSEKSDEDDHSPKGSQKGQRK